MEPRMSRNVFRRIAGQIFLGGLRGIVVGMCAGAAVGVFFFVIGAFFGAIIAIPFGFAAGVIGCALGGRRGWAIGGASSLAIPLAWNAAQCGPSSMAEPLALLFLAGIYGAGIGIWYGGRATVPMVESEESARHYVGNVFYEIYEYPLIWRILAALAILATVAGVIWDLAHLT
jgi:hypothetical protein